MKTATLILLTLMLVACNDAPESNEQDHRAGPFITSAHYFSSTWPKTFWQDFERADVAAELQQIKADGFNTIVLTVPWRGFEINFQNPVTDSVETLYDRFEWLLAAITDQQMQYILRVGFPHDYTPDTGITGMQQCVGIYTKDQTRAQWLNYLDKVKTATAPFTDHLAGVLISWEDFWCPHFVFPHLPENDRLQHARQMGYGEWLKSKDSNVLRVLLGVNELNHHDIPIPTTQDESYVFYIEFIDQQLDQILLNTQQVFPQAALEIRVDKDPVKQGESFIWVGHELYLDESNHRGTYWAPFWGAANQGELLTAEQALKNFRYFLKYVTADGNNTNHVIEQFNFTDNTPYFPNNANILPDEIDDFLLASAPLLKQYTAGAGVWAYRNYHDNALYNGSFEMGLNGWQTSGQTELQGDEFDRQLSMTNGSTISQSFIPVDHFMLISAYETVDWCFVADAHGQLELLINEQPLHLAKVMPGENCFPVDAAPLKSSTPVQVGFIAHSDLVVDEFSIHGFTQDLGLYQTNGEPGRYLPAYRQLNQLLLDD